MSKVQLTEADRRELRVKAVQMLRVANTYDGTQAGTQPTMTHVRNGEDEHEESFAPIRPYFTQRTKAHAAPAHRASSANDEPELDHAPVVPYWQQKK